MALTWGDILVMFVVIVVGSFVAGAVATWWEQRKRDKPKGE